MNSRALSATICVALALSSTSRAASVAVVDFVSSTTNTSAFVPQAADATIYQLIAGQHIDAGTVTVFSTPEGRLVVTYRTTGGWSIKETHLEVALRPKDFPQTKSGNPQPGRFDYGGTQTRGTTAVQYVFDWGPSALPGTVVYVAAHAVVTGNGTETAWSAGHRFAGSNWFTYSEYVRPQSLALGVKKMFLPDAQLLAYDGNFYIEVTNFTPRTAGTIVVSDTLDPLFLVYSASVDAGTGVCSVVAQSLSCAVTSLPAGETALIHVYYNLAFDRSRAPGSLVNCATATAAGLSSARGCATMTFTLGPA